MSPSPSADLALAPPTEPTTAAPADPASKRGLARRWGWAVGSIAVLLVALAGPDVRDGVLWMREIGASSVDGAASGEDRETERRIDRLERALAARVPRGAYLIVSSSDNHFELRRGEEVLRGGLCSTGSYVQLRGQDGREWLFETPRGTFRIQNKRTNPVWTKPDWAFVEAGLPVPPMGSPERVERGVLGDYALGLGDGYLIHGTLYQRLLGRPVTHGCVRLGDADLEAVYRALPVGAPVFIY